MRRLPTAIAALVLLAACRAPAPVTAAHGFGSAGLAALLPPRPMQWRSTESGRFDRAAVLVAADSYAEHPEWALPGARTSMERLGSALTDVCGVSPRALTTLRGSEVHRDAVLAALGRAADQLGGPSAVLFVGYAGHGFVDGEGDPVLFGHYTTANDGGGFRAAIGRRDLVQAVGDARDRAAGRGVLLRVVFVIDACRTSLAAPPPKAILRDAPIWELWGTRAGTYARAGDGEAAFPFTVALCAAMRALADTASEVDLRRVADEARTRTLAATAGEQEPELLGPRLAADPPAAIVSGSVSFRVTVEDAVSSARVPTFSVRIGNRTFLAAGDGEALVHAVPGRQSVEVVADGYLPRVEDLEVGADHAGAVLDTKLYPALVMVSGRVTPPAVVAVRAVGALALARPNYHLVQTVTGRDGAFQLRLPPLAAGMSLEFLVDGKVTHTVDLPHAPTESVLAQGLPAVPRVDLEVPLVGATPALDLAGAQPGQPSTLPRGRDPLADAELGRVFDLVRAGRLDMARDALAATEVAAGDEDLRQQWLTWLELRAACDAPPSAGLARLAALHERGAPEDLRRSVALALLQGMVDRHDWQGVLDLDSLQDSHGCADDPAWAASVRQALPTAVEQVLRAGLLEGVQEGTWTAADGVAAWLLDARHLWVLQERPAIAALQQEVQRERIDPVIRTAFERGEIALVEGRLGDARQQFVRARGGANEHYRQRIDEHLQQLDLSVFEASMRTGTAHELAGRRSQALAAYARAYALNPRASESVRRVLHASSPRDADFERMYEDILGHVLERVARDKTAGAWAELSHLFADDARAREAMRQGLIAPWADIVDGEVGPSGLPRVVRDRKSGLVLRLIEPGTFVMGAPESDELASAVERPRHRVTLLEPFYLGETEVTWEAWRRFAAETGLGSHAEAGSIRHPVAGVSWREATAFCAFFGLRLPTEVEWEYAARAGNGEVYRRYPWGDDPEKATGNLRGRESGDRDADRFPGSDGHPGAAPVGSFEANAWGFHDLVGNVREWCADTFDARAYRRDADRRDPQSSRDDGASVVARGASFQDGPRTAGVATRFELDRDAHLPWVGLRAARSVW
ncbi:MAG: SUMF1/EgtB/PvdO family nonheme iron enzyme [Planctomycetota bacterium]